MMDTNTTLVAGKFTAVRDFSIDSLGRLTSPYRDTVWTPGVNTATCERASSHDTIWDLQQKRSPEWVASVGGIVVVGPHEIAMTSCSCGMHAYRHTRDARHYSVTAVINMWGNVSLGEDALRGEHAEVVGIYMRNARLSDRIGWSMASSPWKAIVVLLIGMAAFVASSPSSWGDQPWWRVLLGIVGVAFYAIILCTTPLFQRAKAMKKRAEFNAVRSAYPDVPIYRSMFTMLRSHPISLPDPQDPPRRPSPSDPDFWTAKA